MKTMLMVMLMAGAAFAGNTMFPYLPAAQPMDPGFQPQVIVIQTVVVIQQMPMSDRPIPLHEFHRMACARPPVFPQQNPMPPVEQTSLNYNLHMGRASLFSR